MVTAAPTSDNRPLHEVRVVLCRPKRPGNVGGAARAMKTMGFGSLVLVDPFLPADDQDAVARAWSATDVLSGARTVATVAEAVADCVWVVGLSARSRSAGPPVLDVREAAIETAHRAHGGPVAWLFGTERGGLSNDELLACQALVQIPTGDQLTSLNLAAAVQVATYELHRATATPAPSQAATPAAPRGEVDAYRARLHRGLVEVGRYDPDDAKLVAAEHRFWRALDRMEPTTAELRAMHAMLKWLGH